MSRIIRSKRRLSRFKRPIAAPLSAMRQHNPMRFAGVGVNQTGIDGEAFAADKTFLDAALQNGLKQSPQQIAVTEATMAVLRERRMVGHCAIEPEPTKPAIRQVEVHLIAQPPLRPDAEAIADDQHPNQQLGISMEGLPISL